MNLIFLYMTSKFEVDENESAEGRKRMAEGAIFVWMVNVALDVYLISQLSTVFGG